MDHRELADLVMGLEDTWTRTDENIARLVDRDDYYLRSMYQQWTADPDDPEAQRERDRRKRLGIKPPPQPLIAPVAVRPAELTAQMWQTFTDDAKKNAPPRKTEDGRTKVSIKALRAQMGKDT